MDKTPEEVTFRGRKKKIGWLRHKTLRHFTHIMLTEENIDKRNVKLCACILTNDVFAWFRRLVYALRWRWYWYVIDLDDIEVLKVIDAAKKKIPFNQSQLITTLSTGMKDTMMAMTKQEFAFTQAAQTGEPPSR